MKQQDLMEDLTTYLLPGCVAYWQSAWSTGSLHDLLAGHMASLVDTRSPVEECGQLGAHGLLPHVAYPLVGCVAFTVKNPYCFCAVCVILILKINV